MANIIRSAKSGNDWSTNELFGYNITIQTQSVVDFFGHEPYSIDHLDPDLFSLSNPSTFVPTEISVPTRRFLEYLYLTTQPGASDSTFIGVANSVLEATNFNEQIGTAFLRPHRIPFTICGDTNRKAISDICLLSTRLRVRPLILLLVQQHKPTFGSSGPEPPVIAGAIATFQDNNRNRAEMGLPTLDTMTIPCITVMGTRPLFYKVPVTQHLSDCVVTGQFPHAPNSCNTVWSACPTRSGRRHGVPRLSAYRPLLL